MKKLLIGPLLLCACSAGDLGVDPDAPPPSQGAHADLDDTDVAAFNILARVIGVSRRKSDQIWAEGPLTFAFHHFPIYFVRRDASGTNTKGYILNFPSPPNGARAVMHDAFAGIGQVYRYDAEMVTLGDEPNLVAGQIANRSTFVFPYSSAPLDGERSSTNPVSPAFIAKLIHAGFHRHQQQGRWQQPQEWVEDEPGYPMNATNLSLAMLESEILRAGLRDDPVTALRQYVAVRATRIADPLATRDGKDPIVTTDNAQEWSEGTAEFVERRFMAAMGLSYGGPSRPTLATKLEYELQPHAFSNMEAARRHFAFGRLHATGCTVLHLLEGAGIEYRDDLQAGVTPYEIALNAYPDAANVVRGALVEEAKATHGYDDELVALARSVAALL